MENFLYILYSIILVKNFGIFMLMPDIYSAVVIGLNSIGTLQWSQTLTAFVVPLCSGCHYCTTSFNKD